MFTRCTRCLARISLLVSLLYDGLCKDCAARRNAELAQEYWNGKGK